MVCETQGGSGDCDGQSRDAETREEAKSFHENLLRRPGFFEGESYAAFPGAGPESESRLLIQLRGVGEGRRGAGCEPHERFFRATLRHSGPSWAREEITLGS